MKRHGRWKLEDEDCGTWRCDGCGLVWHFSEDGPFENEANFCPKCGRRMIDKGKTQDDIRFGIVTRSEQFRKKG